MQVHTMSPSLTSMSLTLNNSSSVGACPRASSTCLSSQTSMVPDRSLSNERKAARHPVISSSLNTIGDCLCRKPFNTWKSVREKKQCHFVFFLLQLALQVSPESFRFIFGLFSTRDKTDLTDIICRAPLYTVLRTPYIGIRFLCAHNQVAFGNNCSGTIGTIS